MAIAQQAIIATAETGFYKLAYIPPNYVGIAMAPVIVIIQFAAEYEAVQWLEITKLVG